MWGLVLFLVVPQSQALPHEIGDPLRKYASDAREASAEKPAKVGSASGYSITLRKPFYTVEGGGQGGGQAPGRGVVNIAPPAPSGYDHEQIIVIAGPKGKAPAVAVLPWEPAHQTYHHERIYLGRSQGYHWYGDMPLWAARRLAGVAGLQGGPDPIDLALRELEIDDQGNMTANSGIYYLRDNAEKAFPKLKAVIFSKTRKYPERAIRSLGGARSRQATTLLLQLYASKNEKLRGTAGYALIHKPYRKEAKSAYLDMIARRTYIAPAAEAAVEFGWTEAAKPLLASMSKATTAWQYAELFLLGKRLTGVRAPDAVQEIRTGPWTLEKVEKAKAALLSWQDREAAAVVAFSMVCLATKADTSETHRAGREILLALPKEVTRSFLKSVVRDLPNTEEKKVAQKLLWELP